MEEEEGTTPEEVAETPVEQEAPPATPAPTPAETPVQTISKVDNSQEYETALAVKDKEIERLTQEWLDAKNQRHLGKAETQAAQEALGKAVQERERIVREKDRALAETQEKLETVSQATQTLSQEKTELSTELETQAAKATKLEVLTEEFPELLRYAKLIPASRDADVVRTACKALADARKLDLESQRISAVTGNPVSQMPTGAPRVEPMLSDPEQMRDWLNQAKNDPQEYERRRQALLDQHEAAVQRARAAAS